MENCKPPTPLWQRPDIFDTRLRHVDRGQLEAARIRRARKFSRPHYQNQLEVVSRLPRSEDLPGPLFQDLASDTVRVGRHEDLDENQHAAIERAIQTLIPWRKGPFQLFGHTIDAEWRSNLKWDRIRPAIGNLQGLQILDVGCGNGYYMFRGAQDQPELILGIDPSIPFYLSFELLQGYLRIPGLQMELFGHEELNLFDRDFDQVWCMGVLYHHRDPLGILRRVRSALRVGGVAIVEGQSIPDDGTYALFPEERYAKARNVYFVPTRDCLVNWVRRSGFHDVEVVSHAPVTVAEQRSTELAPYESLSDFLDAADPTKTVEGFPAPWRTVIRAVRKFA